MSELFVDALRYPLGDRSRLNGTIACFVALLLTAALLRVAAGLWPDWAALVPLGLTVGPLCVFFGLLGGILAGEGVPAPLTTTTVRLAGRLVGVAVVYSLPSAVVVAAVAYLTVSGAVPAVLDGVTTATLATVALLVTVVCSYLFPAAATVSVRKGLSSGLSRSALAGTASSVYFLAWVGATVLVVLSWSALAATATRSPAALVVLGGCAYAHVAAAALVADGIERTSHW